MDEEEYDTGFISIVIPTYNRIKTLKKVFYSYTSQSGVGEIIVVDDGSTDGTREFILNEQENDSRIIYVRNERNLGQPAARNIGADRATGKFILYGEDDLRFESDYALDLQHCLERNDGDIAGGRLVYPLPGESDQEALDRTADPPERRIDPNRIAFDASAPSQDAIEVPFIHACAMIRRKVFESIQYDPVFKGNAYREETDFYLRAIKNDFKILFCPNALCIHLPREVHKLGGAMAQGIWNHKYWALRNNYLFLRRHYEFLKRKGIVEGSLVSTHSRFIFGQLTKIFSFYLRRYFPSFYSFLSKKFYSQ